MYKSEEYEVESRIKVGKRSIMPKDEMIRLASQMYPGWFGVDPSEFHCADCGCTWEVGVGTELGTASCSNCYSDNVFMTAITVTMVNFNDLV